MQVKYKQKYEKEKGKVSTDAGAAEFALAKEHAEHLSQVRLYLRTSKYSLWETKCHMIVMNQYLFSSACLHGRV